MYIELVYMYQSIEAAWSRVWMSTKTGLNEITSLAYGYIYITECVLV